jgi:serine/threonine protein kinase
MSRAVLDRDALAPVLEAKGYKFISEIGCGACGRVCLVFSERYQTHFVVKVMSLHIRQSCTDCEITALKQLTCQYVITLFDYHLTPDAVYLFLEYCCNGSLDRIIAKSGPLSGTRLYGISKAFLTGLAYIHSNRCAHSDLKPANILIDRYGRPKIADFGFARVFSPDELAEHHSGTMAFSAPEVFHRQPFDPFKADIWSAAITLLFLGTGRVPWDPDAKESLAKEIMDGLMGLPRDFDHALGPMIHAMTRLDPAKRPTAEECLAFEPIASADVRTGFLRPAKSENARLVPRGPRAPRVPQIKLIVHAARSSSVKKFPKAFVPAYTFDSDPG